MSILFVLALCEDDVAETERRLRTHDPDDVLPYLRSLNVFERAERRARDIDARIRARVPVLGVLLDAMYEKKGERNM